MRIRKRDSFSHLVLGGERLRQEVLDWKKSGNDALRDGETPGGPPALTGQRELLADIGIDRIDIVTVPKPRQTRADKWQTRPAVMRYRAFADECRIEGVQVPESGAHVIFHMPMPKSWSKKKKAEMVGQPHQQKPDVDNLEKALLDAVMPDDSGVWDIRATKLWSVKGAIEIVSGG